MTKSEMLSKMEALLQDLAKETQPKINTSDPVSTTLDIIQRTELNASQRLLLLYLLFSAKGGVVYQKELRDNLGLVMKTIRLNLRELKALGYVIEGTKSFSWKING